MHNPQIKVRLSILERRQIAMLLPEFAKRLELDEPNSRMIPLFLDEAMCVERTQERHEETQGNGPKCSRTSNGEL
jgi:hypothetical protein